MTRQDARSSGIFEIGGDMPVHRLGFGAMRITGPEVWGEPEDEEEARRVLQRAVALEITFLDTADSYGPDVSERLIGETLHPYPPELVIATKGGMVRGGPGEWEPNGRPKHLRRALDGSLRRLRVERIDLYQLHAPDPDVPYEDSVGTLADLQREGKIRHVGISNVDLDQLAIARTEVDVVSVQNRYNLADRSSQGVLDACAGEGLAFLPWRPLALPEGADARPVERIARVHGCTVTQVALAWLLQRSPVMVPIPGTSSVRHLEENVAAAGVELTPDEMEELEEVGEATAGVSE